MTDDPEETGPPFFLGMMSDVSCLCYLPAVCISHSVMKDYLILFPFVSHQAGSWACSVCSFPVWLLAFAAAAQVGLSPFLQERPADFQAPSLSVLSWTAQLMEGEGWPCSPLFAQG